MRKIIEEAEEVVRVWLKNGGRVNEAIASALQAKDDEIAALKNECMSLSANQCHCGYGDEHGNHRCKYQDEIAAIKRAVKKLDEENDILLAREACRDGQEYTVKELIKANAMVCKQRNTARNDALEEACAVVYGMSGSDNVAQRTVDAIRKLKT